MIVTEKEIHYKVDGRTHFLRIILICVSVKTTAWRKSQSPYPKDIQMASSLTATVAIGSRWQCKNTWQRFWVEGIDREFGTKDAGSPICSLLKAPILPSCVHTSSHLNQSHSDISDQPVDCACVLSLSQHVFIYV